MKSSIRQFSIRQSMGLSLGVALVLGVLSTPLAGQEIGDLVRYKLQGDFGQDWREGVWEGQSSDKTINFGTAVLFPREVGVAEYLNERPWAKDALWGVAGGIVVAVLYGKFPIEEGQVPLTGPELALASVVISVGIVGGISIARAISPEARGKWEEIPLAR